MVNKFAATVMFALGCVIAIAGGIGVLGSGRAGDISVGAVAIFLVGCFIGWRGWKGMSEVAPGEQPLDGLKPCPACLKRIPMAASRCSYCTEDFRTK